MTNAAQRTLLSRVFPRWRGIRTQHRISRETISQYGHILLAGFGTLAFLIVQPPVADLQAAQARAGAARRHVGLGYWLSWFGGSTPGQYSILTPKVCAWFGVLTVAAVSAIAMALLARPLLAKTHHQQSASYLIVVSALCNLWSGRVPFGLGMAVSLTGLLLLIRGYPILGGFVNAVGALFSPLAPSFILILLLGPAWTRKDWRPQLIRFGIPGVLGVIVPALYFGAPAAMPFSWNTLAWTLGIIAAALLLDLPKQLKVGLLISAAVCFAAFVIPSGVGANMSRYAFLLLPPVIWAVARNPRRVVAIALLPAFAYSGFLVVKDVSAAAKPSAQQTYYTGLRNHLATLTGRDNHRVEVLDTATHRAAAELIPEVYLARGWETQNDAINQLFYVPGLLNPASYRAWLDANAVAWVAVPTDPGPAYRSEAVLVRKGLTYLKPIWHDQQWTLWRVTAPSAIVPPPATVTSSSETEMAFHLDQPATLNLNIKPTKFIRILADNGSPAGVCLMSNSPDSIKATFAHAGNYVITSGDSPTGVIRPSGCQRP